MVVDDVGVTYAKLSAEQRKIMALRFGGAPEDVLRKLATKPGGAIFPTISAHGPTRLRKHDARPWRNRDNDDVFNSNVSFDWLATKTRAYVDSQDGAQHSLVFPPPSTDPTVVNDAIIFTCASTRFTTAYAVSSHSECASAIERYCFERGVPLVLVSDGEPANRSAEVLAVVAEYGVGFQRVNAPHHPHHNAHVESSIYVIKRIAERLIHDSGLDAVRIWPYAVLHAVDIGNVKPRKSLDDASPYARVHGKEPDLRHFKRFGCTAWVLALGSYKDKGFFRGNTIPCTYVGTGMRRNQLGAMFLLADGRSIVTEHYRVDESVISPLLVRKAPALTALTAQLKSAALKDDRRERERPLLLRAKQVELNNLARIGTFECWPNDAVRPDGYRDVRSVWVIKRAPNGELVLKEGAAKARLCLRGDTTADDGATPTFSPCVGWTAMLVFCSIAAAHGAKILQADVVNAYVQAQLHAHPSIPATFMPLDSDLREMLRAYLPDMPRGRVHSVRVLRALYGLRESARLFHDHFDAVLRKVGFAQLGGEPCLYILRCTSGGFLLIALHVDDFLHANCSANSYEFIRAHEAIIDALDGLLKTSQAAIFVGTNITLSDPTADGGPDVLRIDGDGSMHISVASHINAMIDEMLPKDAPPSITDTRVPMAGSLYHKLIIHKQGTLLVAAAPRPSGSAARRDA